MIHNKEFNQQPPGTMLRLVLARARNVCYYSMIDDRPRAQYIHAFRQLRKDIHLTLEKISEMEDESLKKSWTRPLTDILKLIPIKAKSEDCRQLGANLGIYLEQRLNIPLT